MSFPTASFDGLATLVTAMVAIALFYWEQIKKKHDVAKIIVQEIRRAEDVIAEYKEHGAYRFTKKIIATNSWANSIHYFVRDLAQDEIDKVSNLYSTGAYLDSIIEKVSDQNFEAGIESHKKMVQAIAAELQKPSQDAQSTAAIQNPTQGIPTLQKAVPVKLDVPAPWKRLLDEISYKYEPIYHSAICTKLKRIAGLE